MENKREVLQEEFSDAYVNSNVRKTLYKISMRFGKTRMGIKIMQKLKVSDVLICFPGDTVKKSWEDEFEKMKWKPFNVTLSTYKSAHKHLGKYDFIILDEIHEASENQLDKLKSLVEINDNVLGMSGTYSQETEQMIYSYLNMVIDKEYNTEHAIEDDIVADYIVKIHLYNVDDSYKYSITVGDKTWFTTNRKELDYLSKRVKETTGKTKMFATFNRMRWINTCYSAEKKLKEVLNSIKDERHVVYVATTDFLNKLPLNPHHSKLKSDNLQLFINEEIDNIGLIEMAKSGVTFPKTKNIVVANINSNSEKFFQKGGRGLLNDGGIATIHIISSRESFQLNWLDSALSDIPPNKIKYAS